MRHIATAIVFAAAAMFGSASQASDQPPAYIGKYTSTQQDTDALTSSSPSRYRSPAKARKGEDSYVASTQMRQGRFGRFLLH